MARRDPTPAPPAGPPNRAGRRSIHINVRTVLWASLFLVLGYIAFLASGYGSLLDQLGSYRLRALPLYAYCSFLLLVLTVLMQRAPRANTAKDRATRPVVNAPAPAQPPRGGTRPAHVIDRIGRVIERLGAPTRMAYALFICVFALGYAGTVTFSNGQNTLTRTPLTYIVINSLALGLFVVDIVFRHAVHQVTGRPTFTPKFLGRRPPVFMAIGADFAGLAVFCYAAAGILTLFATHPPAGIVKVVVNIQDWGIPGARFLQDFDIDIGLIATVLALALSILLGLVIGAARHDFWRAMRATLAFSMNEALLSLRFVISPLLWLIPAFSLVTFAQQVTAYFASAANVHPHGLWDLVNPFSQSSTANFARGLLDFGYGLLAVALVLVVVAVVEHDGAVFLRGLDLLRQAGGAVSLTLAIFFASLIVTNVVTVRILATPEPFQLGAATLIAVLIAAVGPTIGHQVDRAVAAVAGVWKAWMVRNEEEQVFGTGAWGDRRVDPQEIAYTDTARAALVVSVSQGQTALRVTQTQDFAPKQEVLIIQMQGPGAGTYEFRRIGSVDNQSLTLDQGTAHGYRVGGHATAQVLAVPHYRRLTIAHGGTLRTHEWDGQTGGILAVRVSEALQVEHGGRISASACGFRGGDGEPEEPSRGTIGHNGESYTGPGSRSVHANGGGGGGGCDFPTHGASGGSYDDEELGEIGHGKPCDDARAGEPYGTATFPAQVFLGSGGGSAGTNAGGNGGGAILIWARQAIITGHIACDGTDGHSSGTQPGGGGGSGGSVLLISQDIDVGLQQVTARGGQGGTSTRTHDGVLEVGGNGGRGRIVVKLSDQVMEVTQEEPTEEEGAPHGQQTSFRIG